MPALHPQQQIITLEQYEALPEDVRVEIFEGQIYDIKEGDLLISGGIPIISDDQQVKNYQFYLCFDSLH